MPTEATDDNILDLDSSAGSDALDVSTGADAQVVDADSSAAQASEKDEGTLSLVRDVVDQRKEEPASSASQAEGEGAEAEAAGADTKKEPDDEAFSDVPFSKHPRFQQLIRQRNEYRTDAQRYQNVQGFLDSNGLAAEEAADGLLIMATAKRDPVAAWEMIKPWVQNLLVAAGEVVPEDLQQRVQSGELTRDAALEVSRARAAQGSVKTQRTFEEQQAERNSQKALATSLKTAATTWEADRIAKDPNFTSKIEPLQKELLFLQSREGKPTTADGVTDQLKRAYKAVNESIRPAAQPNPRPKSRTVPVTGGQISASGAPQPKPENTLDMIRSVVAARRSA